MSASIPNEFIDELLNRIDIYDVVAPRVTLKKAGKDYSGLCPFHNENTPSFTVSQQKQFFHCFGCGQSGSAIRFLMEFEGLDFVDAVKELAEQAGVEVPLKQVNKQQHRERTNLYAITEKVTRIYQQHLKNNQKIIDYIKNRGIDGKTCQTFQIGFAEDSWDGISKRFPQDQQELLDRCGLLSHSNQKSYDKFRNRLMFPIHDRRGRVIAFGGRAVDDEQQPKYLNSPETDLFHKGRELYGYHLARKHSSEDFVIVVEGYMDVVALHQHGIKNTVATLGTATSTEHIALLFKTWTKVVFCFDGDSAGQKAAKKALLTALPLYLDDKIIEFLFLPEDQDPDSYVNQNGQHGFLQQLQSAVPLSQFLMDIISEGIQLNTLDGKAQLHERAKSYLKQLPHGAFRQIMHDNVANISGITHARSKKPNQQKRPDNGQLNPMRRLLSLILNKPALCEKLPDDLDFTLLPYKGAEIINKMIEIQAGYPQINSAALLEHFRNSDYVSNLSRLMVVYDHMDETELTSEMDDLVAHLEQLTTTSKINQLREKQLQDGLTDQEKQQLIALLTKKIK
ncbi:DNA primase [Marinicella gelatinilytica]|uniref:DNA primase n=1 Tax=Marinicella gelatinilytica TaxID=2996017 RepID=UPI002260FC94|nr:DNA primase [Marinicella gelatinilytica]MCX7545077.1 DNA primase [Marinicella gelatinilytica]